MNHRINRIGNVTAAVHDHRCVSGAHADRRLSGRICRLYHPRSAGSQYHIRRLHHQIGKLNRRFLHPSDNPLRSTGLHCRLQHRLRCLNGTFFSPGMGTDQNGIPCFQADQALKNRRRCGICGRNNGSHQSYRFRNLFDSKRRILLDHTTGLHIFIGMVDVFRRIMIFNHLVLHNPHTCFLTGHLRQRNTLPVCRHGRLKKDSVHLFL